MRNALDAVGRRRVNEGAQGRKVTSGGLAFLAEEADPSIDWVTLHTTTKTALCHGIRSLLSCCLYPDLSG